MKKNILIFLIFGMILCLGVGYAVVNSVSLNITGNVGAQATELNTFFTGNTEKSTTGSAAITPTVAVGSKTASVNISNMSLNETVTVEYEIANEEVDIGSWVTVDSVTNSNPTYFEVNAWISGMAKLCPSSAEYGVYNRLVLTVKMIKTPIESNDGKTEIGVSINATPTYDHKCPDP